MGELRCRGGGRAFLRTHRSVSKGLGILSEWGISVMLLEMVCRPRRRGTCASIRTSLERGRQILSRQEDISPAVCSTNDSPIPIGHKQRVCAVRGLSGFVLWARPFLTASPANSALTTWWGRRVGELDGVMLANTRLHTRVSAATIMPIPEDLRRPIVLLEFGPKHVAFDATRGRRRVGEQIRALMTMVWHLPIIGGRAWPRPRVGLLAGA